MSLSFLCVAHCLLVPLLVLLMPVVASLPVADEGFHQLLVWAVLPSSLLALTLGCRKHRHWQVLAFGGFGLLLLVGSALFGHDLLGELGEKLGTVIASGFIAASHLKNYRLCKKSLCKCSGS